MCIRDSLYCVRLSRMPRKLLALAQVRFFWIPSLCRISPRTLAADVRPLVRVSLQAGPSAQLHAACCFWRAEDPATFRCGRSSPTTGQCSQAVIIGMTATRCSGVQTNSIRREHSSQSQNHWIAQGSRESSESRIGLLCPVRTGDRRTNSLPSWR